jgi:NagD protein
MNTADFLSETDPGCTVFVIGEGGLLAALHEHKIASDAIRPRYVVVGEGTTSMDRLTKAHECIERGARLLCAASALRTGSLRPSRRGAQNKKSGPKAAP